MEDEKSGNEMANEKTAYGICRYCGQMFAEEADTQEDADELATRKCSCGGAQEMKRIEKMIDEGQESVRNLFGPICDAYGFKPVEDGAVVELLNTIVELTARDKLNSTSIAIHGYGAAQISRKSDGKLRVVRTRTLKKTEETR